MTDISFRAAAVALMAMLPLTADAAVRTWDGGGSGDLASTAANWDGGASAPTAGDGIFLPSAANSNVTWDLDISVAAWTQASNYTGTVTFETKYPGQGTFTDFDITGDCVISNGTWTHPAAPDGDTSSNRLSVTIGGHLTIGPLGTIDVTAKGFTAQDGPGSPAARQGGSHGGESGVQQEGSITMPAPTYGSIKAPTALGSGGGNSASGAGGGAVLLDVTGNTHLEGAISANGEYSTWNGPGAGGSVFLTTGTLSGNGSINADGGDAQQRGAGGGGRIAVVLTTGSSFGSVDMACRAQDCENANGSDSAAGTVYTRTSGGYERLIVDNNNQIPFYTPSITLMPADVPVNLNTDFDEIVITNQGTLGIATNTTVDLGALGHVRGAGHNAAYMQLRGTNIVTFPSPLVLSNGFSLIFENATTFSGNLVLTNNSGLSHAPNIYTETHKLDLTIGGDLVVGPNSGIRVDGRGYYRNYGPGAPTGGGDRGASYGGIGTEKYGDLPANSLSYGSALSPTNIGSGGSTSADNPHGGGAIILNVTGDTVLNGTLSARGEGHVYYGGGSGGSVFLTTDTLAGGGTIDAAGANEGENSSQIGNGGGRISVLLNSGASFGSVTMEAYGGGDSDNTGPAYAGASGTVYTEMATESGGLGVYTVKNNIDTVAAHATEFPPTKDLTVAISNELAQATVVVTNRGRLKITADAEVGDLYVSDANAILDLNFNTLYVHTYEHPIGAGTVTNLGAIVWDTPPQGTVIWVQ